MHELSIASAAVEICREHARGRRVARVELAVGHLRQVVPGALVFAFALVAEGTEVEGAELEVEEIPARVACDACGAESAVSRLPLACPRCGALDTAVVAGEECHVAAIEIEEEEAPVAAPGR